MSKTRENTCISKAYNLAGALDTEQIGHMLGGIKVHGAKIRQGEGKRECQCGGRLQGFLNVFDGGWGDGSMLKSTDCSPKGSGFDS